MPGNVVEDIAMKDLIDALRAAEAELTNVLDWHRVEAISLREQELQSIRKTRLTIRVALRAGTKQP